MSSTGDKTTKTKLGSLTLSVDCLVHLCPRRPERPKTTVAPPTSLDGYTKKLAREHDKIMSDQIQVSNDFLSQFSDNSVTTSTGYTTSTEHATGKTAAKLQNKRFAKELAQNNSAPLYPEERKFIEQTLGKNSINYKLDAAGFKKLFKTLNDIKAPSEFHSSNQ